MAGGSVSFVPDTETRGAHVSRTGPTRRRRARVIALAALLLIGLGTAGSAEGSSRSKALRVNKAKAKAGATVVLPVVTATTLAPKPQLGDPAGWVPTTFQATLEQWLSAQPGIGSVAVAIAGTGQEWIGDATRSPNGAAFHAPDRYPALSITKTFTASLVLRAAAAGRLALDAAPPEIVGLRPPQMSVTIRQLLTHTSGLPDYTESPNYRAGTTLLPIEAVALATDLPQLSQPGTTVHYANANYLYLQLVLEQVNARPYDATIADLAAEVGLPETALEPPDHNGWAAGGSGGIRSTVGELARWGSALFTPGRVLSAQDEALLASVDDRGVGIGTWPICPCWSDPQGFHRYTAIGHHIASGGMWYFPATGLTVAIRIDPSSTVAAGLAAELGGRMSGLFRRR